MHGYAALRLITVMGLGPCRAVDAPADAPVQRGNLIVAVATVLAV